MNRRILPQQSIHATVAEKVATNQKTIVDEVEAAIQKHPVVVVGMAVNPFPRKVRALLKEKGIAFEYLEYGSYLSMWRPRTALKMWSGWSTYPMVFVKGTLIGGFEDTKRLLESGEFQKLMA
jgi:monothiol glutaredoxin